MANTANTISNIANVAAPLAAPLGPLGPLGVELGGKVLGGLSSIFGGDAGAEAQQQGISNAKTDINTGFDAAKGIENPIYQTGLSNLNTLSDKYNAGGFSNPTMRPYKFDPQSVFSDPEYAAQMKAGTDAINGGAEKKGTLFSGANDRDLTKFGQDTFAGRSDDLYNRGFNATNTAYNQNSQNNATQYNEGAGLTNFLPSAANNLSNLNTQQGENLGNLDLTAGGANGSTAINTGNTIGNTVSGQGGLTDLLSQYLNPNTALKPPTTLGNPISGTK
jgi:hypothetical protein